MMDFKEGEVLYFNKPLGVDIVQGRRACALPHLPADESKEVESRPCRYTRPACHGRDDSMYGQATKRIEEFQYHTKEYIATIRLGATTPSYDLEHEIDATYPTEHITRELVEETLKKFTGEIQQVPPAFFGLYGERQACLRPCPQR